jgi:hypothetical protein
MKKLLLVALIGWSLSNSVVYAKSFQDAVADAAVKEESEISSHLIAIDEKNPALIWNADKSKILVVTWKNQAIYDKYIKPNSATDSNPDYATWVTTAPQVQKFCQDYLKANPQADKQSVSLRLEQYLGLKPQSNYDVFVEMWVSPADLFRPCADPEVNDAQCNLNLDEKTPPQVKKIVDYKAFYQKLSQNGYPWTGLGYTYDWGNAQSEEGASEFILVPQAKYEIKQALPTQDYCRAAP